MRDFVLNELTMTPKNALEYNIGRPVRFKRQNVLIE